MAARPTPDIFAVQETHMVLDAASGDDLRGWLAPHLTVHRAPSAGGSVNVEGGVLGVELLPPRWQADFGHSFWSCASSKTHELPARPA